MLNSNLELVLRFNPCTISWHMVKFNLNQILYNIFSTVFNLVIYKIEYLNKPYSSSVS
jgi:hypothetical protein